MNKLELLRLRKSVRSYDSSPISATSRRRLDSEATYIESHESGLRFRVCYDDPEPFKGMRRSYGMFRGVNDYLAVIIDPTFPHTLERAGYFAEQWVMEAVQLGLGTCFVEATYDKSRISTYMEVYEKMPFVVAFGNAAPKSKTLVAKVSESFAHRKVRPARYLYDGDDLEYENAMHQLPWLGVALEAVACAPSAYNRQPVRLKVCEHEGVKTIEAHTIEPGKYLVDLGIAKCNVAIALDATWEWGESAPLII